MMAENIIICGLLILSVMLAAAPILWYAVQNVLWLLGREGSARSRGTGKRLMVISGCMIVSIWCLRLAVGLYGIGKNSELTVFEELFNSFVHALQTFSMDEDYTGYITAGKTMMRGIFGEETALAGVYGIWAAVLNAIAPVVGGAIIFQVLASILPGFRLHTSFLAIWKEKYYFSELNEHSLALAGSICDEESNPFTKPILVFTDTYIDNEDEKRSEMLIEAKRLGAICIRDDLAYIAKSRFGKRKYFLIDELEIDNLEALTDLAKDSNCKYLSGSEIYLFSQDDAYTGVERTVRAQLAAKQVEVPDIIPVQSYRNLVSNLLVDLPLYEPLVGKKSGKDGRQSLCITILGTGAIGTEMFLSAYWCAQLLDCVLTINVVSRESEEEFRDRIDYINPDIFESCRENSAILRVRESGAFASPYGRINYYRADVKTDSFADMMSGGPSLLDTDYFVVALGSDEENLSVANKLRRIMGRHHLTSEERAHTVIAYVVYNSVLCRALNRDGRDGGTPGIYMYAFGCHEDVYSTRNIFMKELIGKADGIHGSYRSAALQAERHEKIAKRVKSDDYTFWASLARAMHTKYKMYSAGCIDFSVFDTDTEDRERLLLAAEDAYLKKIYGEHRDEALMHRLAWLEHRRWNAFMRIKGFTFCGAYSRMPSQKDIELKLHTCITEMDESGGGVKLDANGRALARDISALCERSDIDSFDKMLCELYAAQGRYTDYRIYDYPADDYPELYDSTPVGLN